MNILVTGHRGRLGPPILAALAAAGHRVRGFDLADGDDILDATAVLRAARGLDAIVHGAGLVEDRESPAAATLQVNLAGTGNVLVAAAAEGVRRVVHLSSGKALGLVERAPDYLPLDDDHRGLPGRPYGLSKWLSEEMCQAFSARTGLETLCLRPVAVLDEAAYAQALRAPAAPVPRGAGGGAWHLGVHLDMRDFAAAIAAALACAMEGLAPRHARLLLCAADIADARPTLDLVAEHAAHIPWRGGEEYRREPFRALVDTARARALLGWSPKHGWPGRA